MQPELAPLVEHLAAHPADGSWRGWEIRRVTGGHNNLLYRATGPGGDLAVKLCRRDARDRAGREHDALRALRACGLEIAPEPLLLDAERALVVQRWLDGVVRSEPPQGDDEWRALVEHYAAIRRVTPAACPVALRPAVVNMASFAAGRALIAEHVALLPPAAIGPELHALLARVAELRDPQLPPAPVALCRVDSNTTNMVRRADGWRSVDWENAGWGDPAFEIVDVMTHIAYADVPDARWEQVIAWYCVQTGDAAAEARIRACAPLMLVWWVVRLARYLHEIPRGLDQSLATRQPGWDEVTRRNYERYAARALRALGG